MSIDLNALATWSYDSGTLTKLSVPTGEVTIDISANPALHLVLGKEHWKIDPTGTMYTLSELKANYDLIPEENWIERKIKWNRTSEDPPVLQIEQHIGEADYVDYNVYLLQDAPGYSELAIEMRDQLNTLRARPYTKADVIALFKNFVLGFQKLGLVDDD